MARPPKQGLDYFSFDVDFFEDEKIEFVTARFGEKGGLITIKLLCNIYRNGYSIEWNEDKATIFAKRAGNNISPPLVNDVVEELVKRGFFDKSIFNSFDILTSRGIQKRYLQAITERKEVELREDIWLLDFPEDTKKTKYRIIPPINGVNPPINSVNPPINSQSKVKERKVNNENTYVHPEGERACDPEEIVEPEVDPTEEFFEQCWQLYPNKIGKSSVSKKAKKEIANIGYDRIKRAIERYIELKTNLGQFLANGSTFFTTTHKDFLDDDYQARSVKSMPVQKEVYHKPTSNNKFVNFEQHDDWDFDEINRLEEAYIRDKLGDRNELPLGGVSI